MVPVLVGLIPRFECLNPSHRWVLCLDHLSGKCPATVAIEPASDQLIEFGLVAETPTRTMNWHESPSTLHITLQILPLTWRDRSVIRIKEHRVKLPKKICIVEGLLHCRHIVEVDPV